MTPLKVLIVEDEVLTAETIKLYLNERGHTVTEMCISHEEAVSALNKEIPDVVLIDVRLYGEKSGIDLAKYMGKHYKDIPYVFLTSQYDMRIVQNAMSTYPQGYLTKPIRKETVWTTLELAYFKVTAAHNGQQKKYKFYDGHGENIVFENEILYINADHVYVNVHLTNNRQIVIRQSLSKVLDVLNKEKFVQTHRSYVVNIDHVSSYNNQELNIQNNIIPLSRSRKEEVTTILN